MTTTQLTSMRIETILETYDVSADGHRVTGVVKWGVGERQFPDPIWNDFVVVVAIWWLEALKVLSSSDSPVIFQFMDGPFFVECRRTDSYVHGRFIDNRREKSVVSEWVVSLAEITDQIRAFARVVCNYCEKHQIGGRDVAKLQSELQMK